jgi:hypothetical protein
VKSREKYPFTEAGLINDHIDRQGLQAFPLVLLTLADVEIQGYGQGRVVIYRQVAGVHIYNGPTAKTINVLHLPDLRVTCTKAIIASVVSALSMWRQ